MIRGDGRHGETQSAAVLVADPRPGMSRRPDRNSVSIHECEHPEPRGELRRSYETMTETLCFRKSPLVAGRDILQLKLMLHALGYYRPAEKEIALTGPGANAYTEETVLALDKFRMDQEWGTTVPGWVDERVIDRLWSRLKEKGLDDQIRTALLPKPTARR